jgi:hypothetical protein
VPPNHDLFRLYFDYYENTESPVIFHRWSLITCLSAYLGRQFWFPFGANRIFPNTYTMLIGHPGTRKSSAIKLGKKLFSAAGYNTYAAEKTSKEKFLLDLEGLTEEDLVASMAPRRKRNGDTKGLTSDEIMETMFGKDDSAAIKTPREVFIVADEFNEFVGSGNLEFLSLLGMLWDWDDEDNDYKFRLKNSKSVSIYQPTLTILAGNTHAGFVEAFPPQAIGQGFLSRLVLIYGEPSGKKIPFPKIPSVELGQRIITILQEIKSKVVGPAALRPDAERALDIIYRSQRDLEDGRFKHYSTRRFTHLLKLCLLVAACRVDTTINERDVILANSILAWAERDMPKALGEFGKSRDSEAAGKIMAALYETKKPMSASDLLKIVGRDLEKATQLSDIMAKLTNSGQVQYTREGDHPGYLPKAARLDANQPYTDFGLLREQQVLMGKR